MDIDHPSPQSLPVFTEMKSPRVVSQRGNTAVAPSIQQQSAGLQLLRQWPQGEKERETTKSLSRMTSARNCMASIITSLCCWGFLLSFFLIIIIIPDSLVQHLMLPRTSFVWFLLAHWLKVAQTLHLLVLTSWLQRRKKFYLKGQKQCCFSSKINVNKTTPDS